MNVHISYKLRKTPDLEKEINHLVEKLRKRLQVFRPELLHLKGVLEQPSPRKGVTVSLNLRLPSGQLAAQRSAATAVAAIKITFDDLLQQTTRHKDVAAEFAQVDAAPVGKVPVRSAGPVRADPGVGSSVDRVRRRYTLLRECESLAPGAFCRARVVFSRGCRADGPRFRHQGRSD